MRTIRFIAVLAFVLLLELFLTAVLAFRAVNLAKYPYRLEERNAAAEAYGRDRSPEKEAAYKQELLLAGRHSFRRQITQAGIFFSMFLVVDGIGIYVWRYDQKNQAAT